MSERQLDMADIESLYRTYATVAVETYNEHQSCPPMLIALRLPATPEETGHAVFVDSTLVNLFQKSEAAKDTLMALVRVLLAKRESAGWQHLLEFDEPFVPDAVVHVTEVWMLSENESERGQGETPRGSWEHHPGRREAIMIIVHTARGSYGGTCPIDDKATPKRAAFEPLRLDAKFFGRFSLDDEAPDGPVH